jgi:putative ABC transport system permease protein
MLLGRQLGGRMKYFPLVWAGLWRKPARTIFTFLSIVVAFILFGILSAIDGGLAHQMEVARLDRLFVDTRFGTNLPLAYLDQIARIPGVTVVAPRQILVGYYRDPKEPFAIVMTDRRFFSVRPELNATKDPYRRPCYCIFRQEIWLEGGRPGSGDLQHGQERWRACMDLRYSGNHR